MNGTLLQLTLRRWVEVLSSRNFYLVFVIVVICSAAIGPFGTYDRMELLHRLGFWTAAHVVCWALGLLLIPPLRYYFESLGLSRFVSFLISSGTANLIIGPVFAALLIWQTSRELSISSGVQNLLLAAPLVGAITYVVISLTGLNGFGREQTAGSEQSASSNVPIWADPINCIVQQKLSAQNKGVILAMVAQDHYVDVVTDKGNELLLMRLGDAIEFCDDDNSLQIHRSAWVSRPGVFKIQKDGRNTKVIMPDGRHLPVSRSIETELAEFVKQKPYDPSRSIIAQFS